MRFMQLLVVLFIAAFGVGIAAGVVSGSHAVFGLIGISLALWSLLLNLVVWFMRRLDYPPWREGAMPDENAVYDRAKADKVIAGILNDAGDLVSGLSLEEIGEDGHAVANLLWKISGYLRHRCQS